jgi:ATP-dependent exoDNAse (exonuclease V) beta subunit
VAFGSTPATELEQRREDEELRRLFYVAVTRARDRLYLAANVDSKGQLVRGARSLAALLPTDLSAVFASAHRASAGGEVDWVSPHGAFAFKVCRPLAADVPVAAPDAQPVKPAPAVTAVLPAGRAVVPAAAAPPETAEPAPTGRSRRRATADQPAVDDRLVGTLVHRLFQRRADPALAEDALLSMASGLLPAEHGLAPSDEQAMTRSAVALYRRFATRPEVVGLLQGGECHFEVPFFFDPADRPAERLRGQIDCLVIRPDGSATVVEFKTGRPRPDHQTQAGRYARAVEAALGFSSVEARILYP